jgi:hypothetical protein
MSRLYAMLFAASLLCFDVLPAHATTIPATTTSIPFGNYQGAWAAHTAYAAGSVVTYLGETYFALTASTNITPNNHQFKWAQLPALPTSLIGFTATNVSNLGSYPGTLILEEQIPVTGTYTFNATALLYIDSADPAVYCYVTYGARGASSDGLDGGASNPTWGTSSPVSIYTQAAIADYWNIEAGDVAQLYCSSNGNDSSSLVYAAGMNVNLVVDPPKAGSDPAAINNRPEVRPPATVPPRR